MKNIEEDRGWGERTGAIFGSLSSVGRSSNSGSELARQWGCECVSVAVSSPLMTCFLPCLCKPFHPDPAEWARERESKHKVVHRLPLYVPSQTPLCPSLPRLFIQICQWAALLLSRPITEPMLVESDFTVICVTDNCSLANMPTK